MLKCVLRKQNMALVWTGPSMLPSVMKRKYPFVLFKEILWPNWVTKIRPTLASSLDPFSYKKFRVEKHSDWQKPVTWLAFNQSKCFASYLSNYSSLLHKRLVVYLNLTSTGLYLLLLKSSMILSIQIILN